MISMLLDTTAICTDIGSFLIFIIVGVLVFDIIRIIACNC